MRWLTLCEFARLREPTRLHREEGIYHALLAGLDGGKVVPDHGLDWSDFKLGERPTVRVRRQFYRGEMRRTKTSTGRRKPPISPGAARWVWANRPSPAEGPVFATRTGRRLSDRNVTRALDAVTEPLGLGWVTPHVFRHTCASRLLSEGRSIRQVAGRLGHTDPAFTLRTYVHLMDDGLGEPLDGNGWSTDFGY